MFVRDFVDLAQPFDSVAPRLVQDARWLDPIAHHAVEAAFATLAALRPDEIQGSVPRLTVRCTRGPVRHRGDTLVMPLRWQTEDPDALVGWVEADLEVAPLGHDHSQLALNASTPGASNGSDGTARRVVEAGLRRFLSELATVLEASDRAHPDGADPAPARPRAALRLKRSGLAAEDLQPWPAVDQLWRLRP